MMTPLNPPAGPGHGLPRPRLVLRAEDDRTPPTRRTARWSVNGFPAVVEVWTSLQWHRLEPRDRPPGVQVLGDGTRVALRIE